MTTLRSLRRSVAKARMKKNGMVGITSHRDVRGHGSKKKHLNDSGNRSYFAAHWREFS